MAVVAAVLVAVVATFPWPLEQNRLDAQLDASASVTTGSELAMAAVRHAASELLLADPLKVTSP